MATPANSAAPRKNGLNPYVRNLVALNVFSLKKGSLIGSMVSPDEIRAKLRAASSPVNRWLMTQWLPDWTAIPYELPSRDSTLIAMITRHSPSCIMGCLYAQCDASDITARYIKRGGTT